MVLKLALHLSRSSFFACLAAAAWYSLAVALGLHLSVPLQLALMLATPVLIWAAVTALFAIARNWRSPVSYLPLVACILAVLAVSVTARALEPIMLRHRMADLQAFVRASEVALQPGSHAELNLSVSEQEAAYSVRAERTFAGTLFVSIATEGGFPVKHAGYVYSSSGSIDPDAKILSDWSVMRPITKHWFRAHD